MIERIDVVAQPVGIGVGPQRQPKAADGFIAEFDHRPEFPGGIDMHQRKRRFRGIERLASQMQQDR
jgi:hypothetical protein